MNQDDLLRFKLRQIQSQDPDKTEDLIVEFIDSLLANLGIAIGKIKTDIVGEKQGQITDLATKTAKLQKDIDDLGNS